jgi:Ca-activated chloride channel homolog
MRKSILVACLVLALSSFTAWQLVAKHHLSSPTTSSLKDSAGQERDILPQVLAWSVKENLPAPNFRTGHVNPATLKNYLEKKDYGYCIKLPRNTLIPSASVVDGKVYVSGGFGSKQYYSFDAVTGELKWAVDLDDDGPSAAALQDGIIVFNTESCTIFACDIVTGKQLWSYYLGDPLMSMPTIANGIVFTSYPSSYFIQKENRFNNDSLITPTHVLIAIELKTGKILWQKWIDSDVMSAPVAKGDLLYVTTFSGAVYKLKQKDGEILEAKAVRATSVPVFTSVGELVFSQRGDSDRDTAVSEVVVVGLSTKKKALIKKKADYLDEKVQNKALLKNEAVSMDAGNGFASGAPVSSNYKAAQSNIGYSNVSSLQSFQGSRGIYHDGWLYNTMGDEVSCTDSSGSSIWKYKISGDLKTAGGFMGTPPAYAGGYIIVATLNGEVLLLDEKKGTVYKKYEIKDPVRYQPVIDHGWIYVTTTNGRLHAINTGDANITGWNMWAGNAQRTNDGNKQM